MSKFEVIALGVGDTFSDRHFTTALLLQCEGFRLAIDCPDRYRGVLRAARERSGRELELSDIDHVLITHVHGDHMNGLEGVAFFKHFVDGRPLHLYTAPEVSASLWEQRLRVSMGVLWNGERFREMQRADYFRDTTLPWTGVTEVGPFRIEVRRTLHHVPTCALRIEAAGRRFGYSSDTAFDPGLIDWFSACDLIVHETNFGPAHTPYHALAGLSAELRQRMRLIHYPDMLEPDDGVLRLVEEGEALMV